MRGARGSGSGEQAFFDPMQAFPCSLGQCGIGAHNVADHLPGGEVERALGCGPHGERYGTLRAETDPLCRGFLARPHSHRLREQVHRNRFLSGLEFPTTAKTIQVIQKGSSPQQKSNKLRRASLQGFLIQRTCGIAKQLAKMQSAEVGDHRGESPRRLHQAYAALRGLLAAFSSSCEAMS
jgi:hypothetical protein